jgi:RND family efflux transporter MFP subunit
MDNTTQPEVSDKPIKAETGDNLKKAEVSVKPKKAEGDDKPEAAEAGDKPKKTEVSGKPEKAEAGGKPEDAEAGDKPKKGEAGGKPDEAEADDKSGIKKASKILLYVLLVLVGLFLIKYFFFTPPSVEVAQVRQQDYTGEVQGNGIINVDVLATVGAKIPGRIESVLVNEGDFVRVGQVVATLEDTDIRRVLQRSQAQLKVARMTAQARRATKYQTARAWEREKHLVATGAVSQEEADQYEERDRTAAGAVGAAEAEIGAAEAEVQLQRFNLSQTRIFSYVNGVVTDRPKRSGDAIVPGETVLTVADPKVTLVEAYLDQRFAGNIKAGQTATVILRGRPNELIPGRVYRIRPQADPAAEEMTVEISFLLPPAEQLQIGQWADIYVQVSQTKNALVVPKTAVMTMGDGRYVLVADADNRVHRVNVESLASSPRSQVMAVAGNLKQGDWVLTQPMGIQPEKKVRPIKSKRAADPASKSSSPAMKM